MNMPTSVNQVGRAVTVSSSLPSAAPASLSLLWSSRPLKVWMTSAKIRRIELRSSSAALFGRMRVSSHSELSQMRIQSRLTRDLAANGILTNAASAYGVSLDQKKSKLRKLTWRIRRLNGISKELWYKVASNDQVCRLLHNLQSVSDFIPSLRSLIIQVLSFFHPSSEA
jgi:hypothetical protein